MIEDFLFRISDCSSRIEILDLYFILTNLVDIPISEVEYVQNICFDAAASRACQESVLDHSIPIGKLVL